MQSIDTRQEQAQEDSSPMNVLPQIRLVKGLRALRPWLAALMFFRPGLLSAQSVPISTSGVVSIGGVPRVYNGRYVLQLSDYGFFWLVTTTLTPGHVQAVPKCGVGMPPSDSNLYPLGDCNTITDVTTSSSQVLVRLTSGQCRSMSRGCGGPRDDGHWGLLFGLGNWQYLGDATDPYLLLGNTFPPTGQTADPQGRTWTMTSTDTSQRNFIWQAFGGVTPTPTPTPTPAAVPPTARATAPTLSAQGRGDSANYYGDKWQLQDSSTPGPPTRIDWDFNYKGSFQVDESGDPTSEGTVTGYFPCDPNGVAPGTLRTGANCIQSLGLTNPPASGSYQFAMQSANQYGTSPNTFTSSPFQVVCPQAGIVGSTGSAGTCVKSGVAFTVLTGGNADAGASLGNLAEASFTWAFTGSSPINVSGKVVPVPVGATGVSRTITSPGGYQATAAGTVTQTSLVPRFSLAPNPILRNTTLAVTNQMDKLTTTNLDSVDYQMSLGACGVAPSSGYTVLANASTNSGFLAKAGTAPVTAPPSTGGYCAYLRYNFTPQGSLQQSQIVSNGFTVTDSTPTLGVFTDSAATQQAFFFGGAFQLTAGTTYYLMDTENVAPPSAHFFLNSGSGDVDLPGSPTAGPGPLAWTPSSACAAGCSAKVSTGTASDSKAVVISAPTGPTPTPSPIQTPTPTPPAGSSVTVCVSGPTSGSKGAQLTFAANASGGSGNYSYSWACDYVPSFPIFAPGLPTATCSYFDAGTHNVVAQVRDAVSGASGVSPYHFVAIQGPPAPSVIYTVTGATQTGVNAYSAEAGRAITFSAGETQASSYVWDFGDETKPGKSVTKTYSAAVARTVRLTVTGDGTNTVGTLSVAIAMNITPPSFRAVIVPGAAHLDDGTTTWGTDVSVTNAGTTSMNIGLAFLPWDVWPPARDLRELDYGSPVAIASGGSYSVSDVVAALGVQRGQGTLVVKYEGGTQAPLVTARLYFQPKVNPGNISYGSGLSAYETDGAGNISPQGFISVALSRSRSGLQTESETETLDVTVTVNMTGSGSGTVMSSPAGINCPATCSASFPVGTSVQLNGSAAAGSTFVGFTGCDSNLYGQCGLSMNSSKTVTARFDGSGPPLANVTLSVTKTGTGTGTVSSVPAGIRCGGSCSAPCAEGTSAVLTATPDSGSSFSGWGGACSGTGSCSVTLSANASVTATFTSTSAPSPQGDQVLIGLRSDPRYRFVVTLYNAAGSSGDFELKATDDKNVVVEILDGGKRVFSRKFNGLGPYQRVYLTGEDLGLNDGANYVLNATRTSSTGTLLAFGTALDRKTNDLVQITDDSQDSPAEDRIVSYWVAGVSRYDPSYGAHWRTDLRIFNRGSKPRNLYFEYSFTSDGVTEYVAHVDKVPIAAGELLTYDDIVGTPLTKDK